MRPLASLPAFLLARRGFGLVLALLIVTQTNPVAAGEVPPPAPVAAQSAPLRAPLMRMRAQSVGRNGALIVELDVLSPTPGTPLRVDALIDGQVVRGARLAENRSVADADQYTLTVPVPQRDFVLTLIGQQAGAASAPIELRIHKATVDTRPLLNVLAVGVGRYPDQIPTLTYPAKDAHDLVWALQSQENLIYRAVQPRVLTEGAASRSEILAGLKWLQEATGPDDTALVFIAGHGTSEPDGSYFFLPADARGDRDSLLSGTELQTALRGVRGKVVLLLDTCHSGNVLWRRSLTRLINELVTENRMVVLAASTGDQSSRESAAWKNGAFTKALVEGLRGAADYAENGQITLSELETWVGVRVAELTQGAQTPTMAKPNAAPDYVIAALPRSGRVHNPQIIRRQKILWSTVAAVVGTTVLVGVLASQPWRQTAVELTFSPATSTTTSTLRFGSTR